LANYMTFFSVVRTRTSPPTHTPREMRVWAGWPFAAGPTARRYSSSGGTGLGLYLPGYKWSTWEAPSPSTHHTWTDAHSGAEFRVKLPLRLAACASEQPTETAPPPQFGPGVRVLVADDIKLNRSEARVHQEVWRRLDGAGGHDRGRCSRRATARRAV
jgi:hypothetical protein